MVYNNYKTYLTRMGFIRVISRAGLLHFLGARVYYIFRRTPVIPLIALAWVIRLISQQLLLGLLAAAGLLGL